MWGGETKILKKKASWVKGWVLLKKGGELEPPYKLWRVLDDEN